MLIRIALIKDSTETRVAEVFYNDIPEVYLVDKWEDGIYQGGQESYSSRKEALDEAIRYTD